MIEERICSVGDVPPGSARAFALGKLGVAVVRLGEDWYAIGDRCTHQDVSLAEGEIYPDTLEIETNDVRCSHASTVGPIDEDQRFYLESRGVPTDVAERLIVAGFFAEVLEGLTVAAVVPLVE